jgi:hypothetical protein
VVCKRLFDVGDAARAASVEGVSVLRIEDLGTDPDGVRSFLIEVNEIPFELLIHRIRKIPQARVLKSRQWWLTDDAHASIKYKDTLITIDAVFSDLSVECRSSGETFDEFISTLES